MFLHHHLLLLLSINIRPATASASPSLTTTNTAETGTGGCAPVTWIETNSLGEPKIFKSVPTASPRPRTIILGEAEPSGINCRYTAVTKDVIDDETCVFLTTRYQLTIEKFLMLNPGLLGECGNLEGGKEYCVDGFIEPVRAWDGFCGPLYRNATCLGMDMGQCCNSETWKCGESAADCEAGTCYEGACYGDKKYSTDGTCGEQHRNRLCAGKWGGCCNLDGACGTGEAFCSSEVCQSGDCTRVDLEAVGNMAMPDAGPEFMEAILLEVSSMVETSSTDGSAEISGTSSMTISETGTTSSSSA